MTKARVVDLAEVRRERGRKAREDRVRRDACHKAVDRILDCPYESPKVSIETVLETFVSAIRGYWRKEEVIKLEQDAKALRSRK